MKKIHGGNFLENGRGRHVTIKNARSAKKIFFQIFKNKLLESIEHSKI